MTKCQVARGDALPQQSRQVELSFRPLAASSNWCSLLFFASLQEASHFCKLFFSPSRFQIAAFIYPGSPGLVGYQDEALSPFDYCKVLLMLALLSLMTSVQRSQVGLQSQAQVLYASCSVVVDNTLHPSLSPRECLG